MLFPQIAHDTRPSHVLLTLYETLQYLPSTCKTLYFHISLAEAKGFKYFLFALENLLDWVIRVGGNDVLYLVDITVCRGLTFHGAFSSLIPPMLIADFQLRLASLALEIDQVSITVGNKRIRASVARV